MKPRCCRWFAGLFAFLLVGVSALEAAPSRPNIIVFFVDNFGNGDLRCFNPATPHRTPNVDRLAAEGTKFTSFYVASDDYGREGVEGRVHIHDLHATMLHQLGLDHEKLTYRNSGRDFRLTDVKGNGVKEILA